MSNSGEGPTFDLSNVHQQVIQQYSDTPPSAGDTPAAPSSAAPAATTAPASTPTGVDTQTPPPQTPQASELVEVEIEPGKKVKVSAEGKDYLLRHADYTRKTQDTAKLRKELEDYQASIRNEAEEFRQFLNNPQAVAAFLKEMNQGAVAPADASSAIPAPQDFVDFQTLQHQAQQIQSNMQREIAQTAMRLDNERKVAEMRTDFNKVLDEAIGKHAVLLNFHEKEELGDLIRRDVGALKPLTVEEARQAIVSQVEKRAAKVSSHLDELRKQQAVEATNAQRSGIEPRGGTPPSPPKTDFKLGDKGLQDAAVRWLEANAVRR